MAIRAGLLRHKITVQSNSPTRSASGSVTDSWSTYATRRAEIMTERGVEQYVGTEEDAKRMLTFKVRFDSKTEAITPAMRVSWDSRTFDIMAAFDPTGLRKEVLIEAQEDV